MSFLQKKTVDLINSTQVAKGLKTLKKQFVSLIDSCPVFLYKTLLKDLKVNQGSNGKS